MDDFVDTSKTTVVVTGASGFIGAHVCRRLASRGWNVVAWQSPFSQPWRLPEVAGVTRCSIDMTNPETVVDSLRRCRPAFVVNCAAYGGYPSDQQIDLIYRVNLDAVRYILDTLKDSPGFLGMIQAGSSSEYGLNCTAPSEDGAPLPDSHYSVSKLAASQLVQFYGKKLNLPVWSLRLSSVYGPLEEVSRLIPQVCLHATKRELPSLASPFISRDFVYIDDVVDAFEMILANPSRVPNGEIFNVGTGICTTLAQLVAIVRQQFEIAQEPQWGQFATRHWDHPDWYCNPAKAARVLGWKARTPLAVGLQRTLDWMVSNPQTVSQAESFSVIQRSIEYVAPISNVTIRRAKNSQEIPQNAF